VLRTSDAAVATVEEQAAALHVLAATADAVRRASKRLLTLCDIAVAVGNEPPAFAGLRQLQRALLLDLAALRRHEALGAAALERIAALQERTATVQDRVFHPSNPALVVLDKPEAIDAMAALRRELEAR
jgi:hypothetical protein